VSAEQRPLALVPSWLWVLLAAALSLQLAWQSSGPQRARAAQDLPPPPAASALRLAAFGEPEALARLLMLYLQSYDLGGANALAYRQLDYASLAGWLRAILELDPRSSYPLLSAARVYAEVNDAARMRLMLDFVHEQFLLDPNRRWPWLAHAALLAKHRLRDLPLARRYAHDLQRLTSDPAVPLWAKQMEVFILEDMNELEAARIMLGGMLESGTITDAGELRFLKERLDALDAARGRR
jgi:hypothetical protein